MNKKYLFIGGGLIAGCLLSAAAAWVRVEVMNKNGGLDAQGNSQNIAGSSSHPVSEARTVPGWAREGGLQCVGEGPLSAERISGHWMQSSPLWVDGEVVTCVNGKALVKGVPMSNEALIELEVRSLSKDFDENENNVPVIGVGRIDVKSLTEAMAKSLCDSEQSQEISDDQKKELDRACNVLKASMPEGSERFGVDWGVFDHAAAMKAIQEGCAEGKYKQKEYEGFCEQLSSFN